MQGKDADIHREATEGALTPKGDEVCCRGTLVSDDVGIVKAAAVLPAWQHGSCRAPRQLHCHLSHPLQAFRNGVR